MNKKTRINLIRIKWLLLTAAATLFCLVFSYKHLFLPQYLFFLFYKIINLFVTLIAFLESNTFQSLFPLVCLHFTQFNYLKLILK